MTVRKKRRAPRPGEVFLSHSHHDFALTKKIAGELRRHRIKAWYSEHHIEGARKWQDEIGAALERCDWFVLLLTRAAVKSKWVKHEVSWALADDRYDERVLSVIVEECNHSKLNFALRNLQMITHKNLPTTVRGLLDVWKVKYRPK